MSLRNPLPPWQRRDNFSPSAHQRQNDAINAVASLFGDGTIGVAGTPFGRTIIDGRPYQVSALLWGLIYDDPPEGAADGEFTDDDPRYFVQIQRPTLTKLNFDQAVDEVNGYPKVLLAADGAPPGDHTAYVEDEDPEPPLIVVATDLFDIGTALGERLTGEVLLIECYAQDAEGWEKCYVLIQPGAGVSTEVVPIRIIDVYAGVPNYKVRVLTPALPADEFDPDADTTYDLLFDNYSGDVLFDGIGINLLEIGVNTTGSHWIDPDADPDVFMALKWVINPTGDEQATKTLYLFECLQPEVKECPTEP